MTARRTGSDERKLAAESFYDPYDAMSDEELDAYIARLFEERSGPSRSITVRMPEDLLNRLQQLASKQHMPYQRLMKRMLEESVSALERGVATSERRATARRQSKSR